MPETVTYEVRSSRADVHASYLTDPLPGFSAIGLGISLPHSHARVEPFKTSGEATTFRRSPCPNAACVRIVSA